MEELADAVVDHLKRFRRMCIHRRLRILQGYVESLPATVFYMTPSKLCQTVPNCTKLYQTVPNCTRLYQTVPKSGEVAHLRGGGGGDLPRVRGVMLGFYNAACDCLLSEKFFKATKIGLADGVSITNLVEYFRTRYIDSKSTPW